MTVPDLPEMHGYLDAVLMALPGQQPDRQDEYDEFEYPGDNVTYTGFRLVWNGPDAWPYGVVVTWDEHAGWQFFEPDQGVEPYGLVDEVVPYPELVAATITRLLKVGPDGLPMTGATRWRDADALLASLDYSS